MSVRTKSPSAANKPIRVDRLPPPALAGAPAPAVFHPNNREPQVGVSSVQTVPKAQRQSLPKPPEVGLGQRPSFSAAPPVYRPQVKSPAQPKALTPPRVIAGPRVYRPALEGGAPQLTRGIAPAVYRPILNPRVRRLETVVGIPPVQRISFRQTWPVQRNVQVGVNNFTASQLVQHLWDESQKEDASLVWHEEFRDAAEEFSRDNKAFNNDLDLTMGLASFTLAFRSAVKEQVEDIPLAKAIFVAGYTSLASEFANNFTKANPRIPLSLMVKLRHAGLLVVQAVKYRESVGGQNGMIYYFQVRGSTLLNPRIGEWHVHWEAKNKPGSPGWKRGANGDKVSTDQSENNQIKSILGDLWGVVKSTGGVYK